MLASLVSRLRDRIAMLESDGVSVPKHWDLLYEAERLLVEGHPDALKAERILKRLKKLLGVRS